MQVRFTLGLAPNAIAVLTSLGLAACGALHGSPCSPDQQRLTSETLSISVPPPRPVPSPPRVVGPSWANRSLLDFRRPQRRPAAGQWRSADGSLTRKAPSCSTSSIRETRRSADHSIDRRRIQGASGREAVMRSKTDACVSFWHLPVQEALPVMNVGPVFSLSGRPLSGRRPNLWGAHVPVGRVPDHRISPEWRGYCFAFPITCGLSIAEWLNDARVLLGFAQVSRQSSAPTLWVEVDCAAGHATSVGNRQVKLAELAARRSKPLGSRPARSPSPRVATPTGPRLPCSGSGERYRRSRRANPPSIRIAHIDEPE